jgi:DNA-binding NarL/FixJ family response regulator
MPDDMKVLLVSADPKAREALALTARTLQRAAGHGEALELIEAADGLRGMALAWRHLPDVVVADEITSRAGAFALAKDLTGAERPFPGRIVILLERSVDAWLADWAGADAWFVKPVDPFALADTLQSLMGGREKEAG